MIDGRSFFDQPVESDMRTYNNIDKIATGHGNDYITDCLLDYNYFDNYYKMILIDSSKQEAPDADPKAIRYDGAIMFFITEEAKETALEFLQGTVKILQFYFVLI